MLDFDYSELILDNHVCCIPTYLYNLFTMGTEVLNPLSTLGGKFWAVKIYIPIIEYCAKSKHLTSYIEGTGGGGKMITNLNTTIFSRKIYNELDYDIYCYFKCLSNKKLTYLLMGTLKKLIKNIEPKNLFDLAYNNRENKHLRTILVAAFAFIRCFGSHSSNRTSFSANSFNKNIVCSNRYLSLLKYNSALEGIETYNTNCFNLIQKYNECSDYFYFGDHPYYNTKTYGKGNWSAKEYENFVLLACNTKMKMMICDLNNPYYDILVNKFNWRKYFMTDKPNNRSNSKSTKKMPEKIWVNFEIPQYLLPNGSYRLA